MGFSGRLTNCEAMIGRSISNWDLYSSSLVLAVDVLDDKINVIETDRVFRANCLDKYYEIQAAVIGSSESTETIHILCL